MFFLFCLLSAKPSHGRLWVYFNFLFSHKMLCFQDWIISFRLFISILEIYSKDFFFVPFFLTTPQMSYLCIFFLHVYVDRIWKYMIHLKIIALYLCIHTVLLNFIWYPLNQTLHSFYWTDKNIWFDGEYLINFYQTKMKIFFT